MIKRDKELNKNDYIYKIVHKTLCFFTFINGKKDILYLTQVSTQNTTLPQDFFCGTFPFSNPNP